MTAEAELSMSEGQRRRYRSLRGVAKGGAKAWFRLSVSGTEHIPAEGGFILAAGAHRSIIDTPLVGLAAPNRELRFMGADNYFAIKGLGPFLRSMGGFPVDRTTKDRGAMRVAETVLAQGEPIVIFPEGTRHSGPRVGELKHGAAFLASRAQVPIVPVGIGGAERSLPVGGRFPRPTRVALVDEVRGGQG